jgi:hypothetical protein
MTRLQSAIAAFAIVSRFGVALLDAQTPGAEAVARRSVAERVPIGATVKVRLNDGQQFKAVLFGVDQEGILVKPAMRSPAASLRIPFERLDAMERDEGRIHWGRYVGIGAAVGGALLFIVSSLAR